MLKKEIKNKYCHYEFSYFEYEFNEIDPSLKLERIKFLHFNNINPDNITDNITKNLNTKDPLVPDELFDEFKRLKGDKKEKLIIKKQKDDQIIMKYGKNIITIGKKTYDKMINELVDIKLTNEKKMN